jgi:D-alanyl-D-alanine carboxypeptidase
MFSITHQEYVRVEAKLAEGSFKGRLLSEQSGEVTLQQSELTNTVDVLVQVSGQQHLCELEVDIN